MTKLRTAVVTGADDWLTLEDVCDIQKMAPSAEEIALIRGHKGDVRLLSVADQFVAVMASVPLLNEKLDALRFRKVRRCCSGIARMQRCSLLPLTCHAFAAIPVARVQHQGEGDGCAAGGGAAARKQRLEVPL